MKREIEFRGKTAKGEWVYGLLDYFGKDKYCIRTYDEERNGGVGYQVDENTIGQFVGVLDKNGKKVFLGDIIKANHNFYPYTVFVRECKVCIEDKHGNAIRPTTEALKHFECEVIGNIFDRESDNGN